MPETPTSRETHRSFTVRVPTSLYIEMSESARAEDSPLNKKVNHLLRLGLDKEVQLNSLIYALLKKVEPDDDEAKD